MLAPSTIPAHFDEWNRRHRAPHGRANLQRAASILRRSSFGIRALGPFAWQMNNTTRRFEYPWAYEQIAARGPGAGVVEVGGGIAGLQFVLAANGFRVTNVDPGLAARGRGWDLDADVHARLCRAFGAPVALAPATLGEAGLEDHSVDVIVSISAIEHFAEADLREFAQETRRLLGDGGTAVLTIDLFLNLAPFTQRESNEYGTNVNVHQLLESAGLELVEGDPSELYGFPEFDPERIQARLEDYLVGRYPALTQCLTATARAA